MMIAVQLVVWSSVNKPLGQYGIGKTYVLKEACYHQDKNNMGTSAELMDHRQAHEARQIMG